MNFKKIFIAIFIVIAIGMTGCGDGTNNTPDTNTPDTNTPDTNTPDTNTSDTNTSDTNTSDTNTSDTDTPDTNTSDTNTSDTGTSDTGTSDTGTPDTGTPDTNSTKNITGVAGKGAAIEGRVELFDENNNSLGSTTVFNSNGQYTISNVTYKGKIKAVLTLSKYRDEFLGKNVSVDNLVMKSVTYIDSNNSNVSVNITPVTDTVVKLLGENPLTKSKEQIEETNKYVARAMGMGDIDPAIEPFRFVSTNDGNLTDTPSHRYALALLAISKYSGIKDDDNETANKNRVADAIEDLYDAVVESSISNTKLESIVEDINGAGTNIENISSSDIIHHSTTTPVSQTIADIMPGASFRKIYIHIKDSNATAPTVEDYEKLGVSGVDESNLDAVNEAVAKTNRDTAEEIYTEIQTVVERVIRDKLGNTNHISLTAAEINAIDGVSGAIEGIDYSTALSAATFVDREHPTAAEIQAVVDAVNAANGVAAVVEDIAGNADATPATAEEINAIDGVSGAIEGVDYSTALAAATFADRAHPTATEIQAVITITNGVAAITAYAGDSTKPTPTLQNYSDAGVTGVTAGNLDALNAKIVEAGAAGVDTVIEIQNLANNFPAPLPAGVTITAPTLTATLVSTLDTTYGIDIDGNIPSSGLLVKVPYHANSNITLNGFTAPTFTIDAGHTKNGTNGVDIKFQWNTQNLSAGDGYFDAKIVPVNGAYHAKQLNINASGYTAASFLYATDSNSSAGTLNLRVVAGIPDRSFNLLTNNQYEHQFVYMPVKNPTTGRIWLNNNLGAEYADANNPNGNFNPAQQATESKDYKAYGSLFQWGRKADGHELFNWTSRTNGTSKYGTTDTLSNNPSDALFIKSKDWRVTPDDTLWAGESSPNNVCPTGYRLPLNPNLTLDASHEFNVELNTWDSKDSTGSMSSSLKLSEPNYRSYNNARLTDAGSSYGDYWSGSVISGGMASDMYFGGSLNLLDSSDRGHAMSVRCIKDITGAAASAAIEKAIQINGLAAVVEDIAGNADNTPATAAQINTINGISRVIDGVDYSTALAAGTFADRAHPTATEIQTVIDTVRANETASIIAYANSTRQTVPTLQNYLAAGITGITANNLDAVNKTLRIAIAGNRAVNGASDIQSLVDNLPTPLPEGVVITAPTLRATLVSTLDPTYSTYRIDIDGNIPATGLLIRVPYYSNSYKTLNSFTSSSFTIDTKNTKSNTSGVSLVFQWNTQNLSAGNGYFDARIMPVDSSKPYHAKQLKIGENGYTAASFLYATDSDSFTGTLNLKVITGIPDRSFNVLTNNKYEHQFVYLPVTNSVTARTWLNNNLGAEYADANNPNGNFNPAQQATSPTDYKAYGSMFQWGRKADGHELINWTNGTTGVGKYGTTTTKSDNPANSLFIIANSDPYDWRVTKDDYLWKRESSKNNVCPAGYRLPLDIHGTNDRYNEFNMEIGSWSSANSAGAISSKLKLPMAGFRWNGDFSYVATNGIYWDGTPSSAGNGHDMWFDNSGTHQVDTSRRGVGMSVRCIKN